MAITYDAGTNIITVTGYTEATPCTFTDVYNADVAGGWGKVSLQGTNQFLFDCKLQIGDSSTETWFADTNKQVTFKSGIATAVSQKLIDIKNFGHFRLGILLDATNKIGAQGCSIISLETAYVDLRVPHVDAYGYLDLYDSHFIGVTQRIRIYQGKQGDMFQVTLYQTDLLNTYSTFDIYDVTVIYALYGFSGSATVDDLKVLQPYYGMYANGATNYTIQNVVISGARSFDCYCMAYSGIIYLVNVTCGWLFKWGGSANAKIYRQYTFDLVTEPNATVILLDKNGDIVFRVKTDSITGAIFTQTVSRGYYDQAHGSLLQDNGPHTLIIRKTSYPEYRKQIVIDEKIDWRISLMPGGRSWITEERKNKEALALLALHAIQERRNKSLIHV